MRLLDAHDSDNAAGVPVQFFEDIFHVCRCCSRYMTKRVSRNHHEADIDDIDLSSSSIPCIYLQLSNKGHSTAIDASKVKVLEERLLIRRTSEVLI